MSDSGGYWLNLKEAEKLTQATLVPGVIEENIRRGGLLTRIPLAQATGIQIEWNREDSERLGRQSDIGEILTWSDNITYTKKDAKLKITYDQTPLNNYVQSVYGNINNYRAITLSGLRKGIVRKLEDQMIYGDLTYGTKEFDGIHAITEDSANDNSDVEIDQGESALSLQNLRTFVDSMKYGIDILLMPYQIARRLDTFYQEGDIGSTYHPMGSFVWGKNEAGARVPFWDGIEIVRTDYLVAEQANTGKGADARAKHSSGDKQYSIFGIKFGQVMMQEPGLSLGFGGVKHGLGEFFRLIVFDDLEDYDAEGLRLVTYATLMGGSTMATGRIFDITDVPIVV